MAELAMLATAIGSAATGTTAMGALPMISTILSTGATVAGGLAASAQGKSEAAALEKKAAEERAMGSRAAEDRRRQTELVLSKQTALAADSGAGTVNPSIIDIYSDTAQRGSYLARSDYEAGARQADSLLDRAAAARKKGQNAFAGSILEGFGTAAKGLGASWKSRDGGSVYDPLWRNTKSYG